MKVLLYRYGSICEPDMLSALQKIGLEVIEEKTEITQKNITQERRILLVQKALDTHHPLFVFSINFYPAIAEICHIYNTLYLCWTVDSPVPELFSTSIQHPTNRIFLFDRAQYSRFHKYNPNGIYHLPLASATERFDQVISSITTKDCKEYAKDISFIGSLYLEKSPLDHLENLSQYSQGFIDGITDGALKVYGYNFMEEALTSSVIQELKKLDDHFYQLEKSVENPDSYIAAHSYLGMHAAYEERVTTLNTLAKYFPVDLYTLSDSKRLENVHVHGGVSSLIEMPKIFHVSKINLNMTIKPIMEGLPLRIFDILGCGGFCMTNYQSELTDYFEIGVDLEAYGSMEELIDKCAYYLEHEEERKQIALNGYRKVCEGHTYVHRINEMIKAVSQV